ncbi:bifunctional phosphoribosyl-AMP cyclohydrolase/phosphoribosyl-ATP diphosphatase HisIE [Leptotrichia shahii]|uniref:bifunctional phosphoribosyl-AMP cyclohydrolase/phosphoribosyl-ATP diphosphatase HisIE n=1 Tax=Leptotrichia shahii TaxID=157691 RepID=UPI0028D1265D|nr:bifunctional phosphoribosyl-AMP cyclohydrolase/phosphoribosyl-ATP diphosphatase HisIE [Leptotrichia shahii]
MNIEQIKFDEKGLVPAIIQDYYTKEVLTLAYMNKESLEITLRDKKTCFFSRSRQELWLKGETSGNYQHVVSVKYDCDADALLVEVKKDGPACHTGTESCFFNSLFEAEDYSSFTPEKLYELIKDRKINPNEKSYTSYLFEKGLDKILKKVGEECTEVIIAAKNNDNDELRYEIADLYYHTLVLMIEQGLTIQDVKDELAKRHVVDHKVKQEKMGGEK